MRSTSIRAAVCPALAAALALGAGLPISRTSGQCAAQEVAILQGFFDDFSAAVSLDGETAIVGAPLDSEAGSNAGAAYILQRDGTGRWNQITKLFAADATAGDHLGEAVSICGDTAVVGATMQDDVGVNAGAAYVFQRNAGGPDNWGQIAKLLAPVGDNAGELFGRGVSIDGDTAIVVGTFADLGAVYERDAGGPDNWGQVAAFATPDGGRSVALSVDTVIVGAGGNTETAYVFQRDQGGSDNWGQVAQLEASDGQFDDQFGASVAIDGDTAVVGASLNDDAGSGSGSAYVFQRDAGGAGNWGEVAKITASDAAASDWFGIAVAVIGDLVAVGARGHDHNDLPTGAAYLFGRHAGGTDNWAQIAELTTSDASNDSDIWLGRSISLTGGFLIAGAGDLDGLEFNDGAYVFDVSAVEVWSPVADRTAADGEPDDWFGGAVSISGDVAVVGARMDDDGGGDAGAVYVLQRDEGGPDNWGEVVKRTASDAAATDDYGHAVAIDGDTAVVGAPRDDDACVSDPFCNSGSAYILQRDEGGPDNWGELVKLIASDDAAGARFGDSADIDGDDAIVGATDAANAGPGAAYVFRRDVGGPDLWGQVAALAAPDGAAGDEFGFSVSIAGDLAVAGARFDDDNGDDSGSAYVFEQDDLGDWGFVTKLTAPDGVAGDEFGYAVAISGDTVIVGSRRDDHAFEEAGSVYVFQRDAGGADNWGQVVKLTASDPAAQDWFGFSVSLEGSTAVVGAPNDDDDGESSGSAYVFVRDYGGPDQWGQYAKLTGIGSTPGDVVGIAVSVDADHLIAGARGDEESTGAVHVFGAAADCNVNGVPDTCDIAGGWSADVNGNGTADECENLGDLDGDGLVGITDFLLLLAAWGPCDPPCPPACAADLDADCNVGINDFLILLANWD